MNFDGVIIPDSEVIARVRAQGYTVEKKEAKSGPFRITEIPDQFGVNCPRIVLGDETIGTRMGRHEWTPYRLDCLRSCIAKYLKMIGEEE